ncbi:MULTISPECIES: DUF4244 domain-containing protein [Streptomyces]|uniref:DUF4244 domain-containing protein n=1 Tax=Streptomyces glycanivorans TaxID=3033808 RepID=A0ABY9JSJ4_9ACTN|nr:MULTISPECIES: DUF4244 domain-containing protein [unclassified Streptomyces]WSQ82373.1 DUF4244 domain-containing protein [Streptomyces sp. NBC_01213]WLQ68982.1 DUF4244 domain-containing protein [Streptomyces sp. Alt3]WSQ89690.1 DUF4244 domain-containing protein [Streptomyces sp. NBC_01212]WSR11328.1 DUF4244 domain-containing protein [Streptomyces sp. NBC_01208]WSR53040.1 DUF4244 domain-containing protein [Streptomyces sp. NBC_01201]
MGGKFMERSLSALRRVWSARFGRHNRCGGLDRGMTTSEYAVGTIAACAFAAVLYKVVTSGAVLSALQSLIKDALDAKF